MIEEQDDERPDWEIEEEEIPESLRKRWEKEEEIGLRAGVCKSCGYPFTKEDLSCIHCGARTDLSEGVLIRLKRWFFKTPLGIILLIVIFAGLIAYLAFI